MKHPDESMSLSKFIAQAGVCSRRKATELIRAKKVKVNGKVITEPGYKLEPKDTVFVGRKKVVLQQKIYILLNKPKGYITTVSDDLGRETVLDLLGKKIPVRLYPVGRLDIQTTGLLLLTNDGELTQLLAHPRHEIKKTYSVTLDKSLDLKDLEKIKKGVSLKDGKIKVDAIECLAKHTCKRVKVILHSGRYRIIRRIFEQLGYTVKELDRVGYGPLTKKGLGKGQWRSLSNREVAQLKRLRS